MNLNKKNIESFYSNDELKELKKNNSNEEID